MPRTGATQRHSTTERRNPCECAAAEALARKIACLRGGAGGLGGLSDVAEMGDARRPLPRPRCRRLGGAPSLSGTGLAGKKQRCCRTA